VEPWVLWLYQLSWKYKLATVTSLKADVSSVSPSSELRHSHWRRANDRNVSFLQLVMVANLHFQLSWYNQITLLPHRRSTTVSLETFTLYSQWSESNISYKGKIYLEGMSELTSLMMNKTFTVLK